MELDFPFDFKWAISIEIYVHKDVLLGTDREACLQILQLLINLPRV